MKCPFRTITVVENFSTKQGSVTAVEFAECLKDECPYYGKPIHRLRSTGGFETVIEPKCRRTE